MIRSKILDDAAFCIIHDRADVYGSAQVGFDAIAQVWAGLDQARGDRPRGAMDVAAFMIAVKLVRAATNPAHADNWVEIAGFAALGGEIATGGAE
ncbi:DUF6378 domain-containing protein [Paracoccus versutus]